MKQMTSGVLTIEASIIRQIKTLFQNGLAAKRQASVPEVGLVSNFDPDQKGFITGPFKGFTMLQVGSGVGTYGTLAAHADYGKQALLNNPFSQTNIYLRNHKMRPEPGQPYLINKVSGFGASSNNSFIRGGKAEPYRVYPSYTLSNALDSPANEVLTQDITYFFDSNVLLSTNTALPPRHRYWEIGDWRAFNTGGLISGAPLISDATLAAIYGLSDLEDLLPRGPDGVIKRNLKPLPADKWSGDLSVKNNDTYWTGNVPDPVTWVEVDGYWSDVLGLTAASIQTYLTAHPGARLS